MEINKSERSNDIEFDNSLPDVNAQFLQATLEIKDFSYLRNLMGVISRIPKKERDQIYKQLDEESMKILGYKITDTRFFYPNEISPSKIAQSYEDTHAVEEPDLCVSTERPFTSLDEIVDVDGNKMISDGNESIGEVKIIDEDLLLEYGDNVRVISIEDGVGNCKVIKPSENRFSFRQAILTPDQHVISIEMDKNDGTQNWIKVDDDSKHGVLYRNLYDITYLQSGALVSSAENMIYYHADFLEDIKNIPLKFQQFESDDSYYKLIPISDGRVIGITSTDEIHIMKIDEEGIKMTEDILKLRFHFGIDNIQWLSGDRLIYNAETIDRNANDEHKFAIIYFEKILGVWQHRKLIEETRQIQNFKMTQDGTLYILGNPDTQLMNTRIYKGKDD